jgi:hypothetical protein
MANDYQGSTTNLLPQTDFIQSDKINRPTQAWIQFFVNLVNFSSSPTATAGSATLPAQPVGFMNVTINGAKYKVPYYDN